MKGAIPIRNDTSYHTLHLFGTPHATYGSALISFTTRKAWALLAYVMIEGNRPHSRSALATMLWPESPPAKAHNSLSAALTQLRTMVARPDAPHLPIIATPQTLQRNPLADIVVDVEQFNAALDACAAHRHRDVVCCLACARQLAEAVALVRGEFLEGLTLNGSPTFEDWLMVKRSHLNAQISSARHTLAVHHEQYGDSNAALAYLHDVLADAPWDEDAHWQVIRILGQNGQRARALKQYDACVAALDREFGVSPSAETDDLAERIRTGTLHPPPRPELCLPNGLSPLVRQYADLCALTDVLSDMQHRLVTICGPSRIRKTHVAIMVANRVGPCYRDGVRMVDLSAAPTIDDIIMVIGAAIGLTFSSTQPIFDQLLMVLADRELLLLLDNAEHLRSYAGLLTELLGCAPNVTVLVTSHVPLDLMDEWVYEEES